MAFEQDRRGTVDDDATVRLRRPQALPPSAPRHRSRRALIGGAAALGAVLAAGVAWWSQFEDEPSPGTTAVEAPPPEVALPPLLDTAGLAAHVARVPTALRWAANPLVWVLDFPDLDVQGLAMNRAAAFLEKARTPRDRVLDDAALVAAIAADRRQPATWYYGHNYRAAELMRMFAQAKRQGVLLNPQELWVESQAALAIADARGRDVAILTVPAEGAQVDAELRRSILTHELGHGQFFTLPFFAAHVMRCWERGFTEAERSAMRAFLAADGYDGGQEELMANEAMAYLLYTPDRRFFDAARDLGWSDAQADQLRALLREGAPPDP